MLKRNRLGLQSPSHHAAPVAEAGKQSSVQIVSPDETSERPSAESGASCSSNKSENQADSAEPPGSSIAESSISAHSEAPRAILESSSIESVADRKKLGKRFQSYELVWKVASDALSTTYAAKRDGIEDMLAVRIFDAKATSGVQLRSIQQAASKAAELTHPGHITVYENGVADSGEAFVVTDWVECDSLAQVLPVVKRLDIGRFMGIFKQVCEVLSEAHSRQLIHGNLTPSKILLVANDFANDVVKVIDFGMPPDPVQNAFYLSPEQCLDRSKLDARTDIYSLACIMYEALCGSPPFVGHKMSNASLNHLHELANQYSPEAPEHNALKLLDCIISKCLQKKPAKRFRNIRELMDALRLVDDCICGNSSKKLPPKAEKLLLFRFLDFFDRKIVACMFSYLLLGGLAVKYIGEIQLQKHIDQAQLSLMEANLVAAESSWKEAIAQADLSRKPPSLRADLHWELGDVFSGLCNDDSSDSNRRNLSAEAIEQYRLALQYFNHGSHFRASSIDLLSRIANLQMQTQEPEPLSKELTRQQVEKAESLFKSKKYDACLQFCQKVLFDDIHNKPLFDYKKLSDPDQKRIAVFAACAANEVGTRLQPDKGIRYFQRALYLFDVAGDERRTDLQNLDTCLEQLKMNPSSNDTYFAETCEALAEGDELAAWGGLTISRTVPIQFQVRNFLIDYATLKDSTNRRIHLSSAKEAIPTLEEELKLREKAFGMNNSELLDNIANLAFCYTANKETDKALHAFSRYFSILSDNEVGDEQVWLAYANLLTANGKKKDALKLLESRLNAQENGGLMLPSSVQYRLVKSYLENNLPQRAYDYLGEIMPVPQPYYLDSGEYNAQNSDAFDSMPVTGQQIFYNSND